MRTKTDSSTKYFLNANGHFVIEGYNAAKPFSNFFPGVAGLWGTPMWVFYVNRGQCIASFGIESKDKAIMEFQPANKAYRLTSLQGFRTFIKVTSGKKTIYWEPFQDGLAGTEFKKEVQLAISAHDLTLTERNIDLGLVVSVNYFTLPQEPYAALVRTLTIKNFSKKKYKIELVDGLPIINPFGLKDWLNKNMTRTVEAWIKVRNLKARAPYYQLNVEVSDKPEVTHIKEGNFYFAFDPQKGKDKLLSPIVESTCLFGTSNDFVSPQNFILDNFKIPSIQQTSNRMPSAFGHTVFLLTPNKEKQIVSLSGYAHSEEQLNKIVKEVTADQFIAQKAKENETIINEIKQFALTKSSSPAFDLYAGHTFLDNILRGGLPVSLKTTEGNVAFNVYSRKHGDLERDYNYFVVAPTFFSQGNGNYRDVNQNRRNDVWFNSDVKDSHVIGFLNLLQADGYNPLVVKGTTFSVVDPHKMDILLKNYVPVQDHERLKKFLNHSFMPGALLQFIDQHEIQLKKDTKEFLGRVLEICHKQESADHGEGFWSDHWTYNLDLIESYLALYPEQLKNLLLEKKVFNFYHNAHYTLPRQSRYLLTKRGVRQYESLKDGAKEIKVAPDHKLRTQHGEGGVYKTNLICKMLCLIANKAASFDPSGIGLEMEADKPNWYDALNGLPGLLGSSISETLELKRICLFLNDALDNLAIADNQKILIFDELAVFINGLVDGLLSPKDSKSYWFTSNDVKEQYRQKIRKGVDGLEQEISIREVKQFLQLVITKTTTALELAKNQKGFLATYFYHDVTKYENLEKSSHHIKPLEFKKHVLPLFLEGYVHALKVARDKKKLKSLYQEVRASQLYDKKLKMYKVNEDLSGASEEIGRTKIFPRGWLENESIWLHMEYKFMLELLRGEMFDEFYDNFQNVLIPFLKPEQYGRNILENSSFIVSSAHEDQSLHGQGFVARLSGSTAEFLHIWLLMSAGKNPFFLNNQNELTLRLTPALPGGLFTKQKSDVNYFHSVGKEEPFLTAKNSFPTQQRRYDERSEEFSCPTAGCKSVTLPANIYAFIFLGSILVVYHNPKRKNTYGASKAVIKEIHLTYPNQRSSTIIPSSTIPYPYADDVRDKKVERIDIYFRA